jgi:HD-GYP domain-containing protein (c-di-GMP phosphodiesterase class II)
VAVEEIVASSGTQFDPEVVEAILQVLGYDRPEKAVSAAGVVA